MDGFKYSTEDILEARSQGYQLATGAACDTVGYLHGTEREGCADLDELVESLRKLEDFYGDRSSGSREVPTGGKDFGRKAPGRSRTCNRTVKTHESKVPCPDTMDHEKIGIGLQWAEHDTNGTKDERNG